MIGERRNHGNLAGIIYWSKSFAPFIMNALFLTHSASLRAPLRSRSATLHSGRLTRDIRFGARLAPHPNFSSAIAPELGIMDKKCGFLDRFKIEIPLNEINPARSFQSFMDR